MPLERGLALGAVFMLIGVVAFVAAVTEWSGVGFGQLLGGAGMRLVILSGTSLVLGTQILYGSFLLDVIEHRTTASGADAAKRNSPALPLRPPVHSGPAAGS
jgi:hypothetical protein